MARAVAKKRKKAAHKSGQRPKAPRTDAQIAAAQANIAKARAAREAAQATATATAHPADENRPRAFFSLGDRAEKREKASADEKPKAEKPEPKGLTLDEMRNLRDKLISMLISLWEMADKGLTLTALLDGDEAFIWRAIDDEDTAFLADRILAKGRENPYVGAQVRAVMDHWQDARMTMILGPKLLESAGWYQARGLRLAFLGLEVPPKGQRQRRPRGAQSNGHQAGQPNTQPYTAEAYPYGAQ